MTIAETALDKRTSIRLENSKEIVVDNSHLLHPKVFEIVSFILERWNSALSWVDAIVINRTSGPNKSMGKYFPDIKTIALNLDFILEKSVQAASKEEQNEHRALNAIIWMNLIWIIGHEIHHAIYYAEAPEGFDTETQEHLDDEEKIADDFGNEVTEIIAMARPELIEPPSLAEMPYFGLTAMAALTENAKRGDLWAAKQKEMANSGLVFIHPEYQTNSLREIGRAHV